MNDFANCIGLRVKQARLKHKPTITQQKLAILLQLEGLDLDQTQISKIESRLRPVFDFEVLLFAKVLGVSTAWLLGEATNKEL